MSENQKVKFLEEVEYDDTNMLGELYLIKNNIVLSFWANDLNEKSAVNYHEICELFFDEIKYVNEKIKNICDLVDIIIKKYNKNNTNEPDLVEIIRLNIIMNILGSVKKGKTDKNTKNLNNSTREHFCFSKFLYNYIKSELKEPEYYSIEIRKFMISKYFKISEIYLKENPFSAYITSITYKEIIKFLKLERGFYQENSIIISYKNSNKRKIRANKKNIKNKYFLLSGEKINENNNNKNNEEILSMTLFNYISFVHLCCVKFENYAIYFEELYNFIDEYMSENLNEINLNDWKWIFISQTKFIKNFEPTKTYSKFKINLKKNYGEFVELIGFLNERIKYLNDIEIFITLESIYFMLINIKNLEEIIKQKEFSEQFQKLNSSLSFLCFNINLSTNCSQLTGLIDPILICEKLFKITNLLFNESLDEYFWIPKSLEKYTSFNEFIQILNKSYNKCLHKKSLCDEQFFEGLIGVKKYIISINESNNNGTVKEKENEQNIKFFDFFCGIKIPGVNTSENCKDFPVLKELIFELIKFMPNEYNFILDLNKKVGLIKNVLLSGLFDLKIFLFLVLQLIAIKKFDENSEELGLIVKIFKSLNNKKYKFAINFLFTIYKSIEKFLSDLINEYINFNFTNNYPMKKYSLFLELFNPRSQINTNNQLEQKISVVHNNWILIKQKLEKTNVLYLFLSTAEEMNYNKNVMNLIEKYIFDIKRKNNIHKFDEINVQIPEGKNIKKIFKNLFQLYYKAYSNICDNNYILLNYFDDYALQIFAGNNNNISKSDNKLIIKGDNYITIMELINKFNQYMISLEVDILFYCNSWINKNDDMKSNNIYLRIIHCVYNIFHLNKKNIDFEKRKDYFSVLKTFKKNSILEIIEQNNNSNERYNLMNYSLWLYEFTLFLEQFELYFCDCSSNSNFINNIHILSDKLQNIFINKRKISHSRRFLLVFNFRRFLFHFSDFFRNT